MLREARRPAEEEWSVTKKQWRGEGKAYPEELCGHHEQHKYEEHADAVEMLYVPSSASEHMHMYALGCVMRTVRV